MAILGACCNAFPTYHVNRSDGTDMRHRRLRLQSRQCPLVLFMVQQFGAGLSAAAWRPLNPRSSNGWGQVLVHHLDQLFHESPPLKRELPPLLKRPMQKGRRVGVLPPANVSFRCGKRNESPFHSLALKFSFNCLWKLANVKHLTIEMFHWDTRRKKCKRFRTVKCLLRIRDSRETVIKQSSHPDLVGKNILQFMLQAPSGRRHTEPDTLIFGFVFSFKRNRNVSCKCHVGLVALLRKHCPGALDMARHHERNTWPKHYERKTWYLSPNGYGTSETSVASSIEHDVGLPAGCDDANDRYCVKKKIRLQTAHHTVQGIEEWRQMLGHKQFKKIAPKNKPTVSPRMKRKKPLHQGSNNYLWCPNLTDVVVLHRPLPLNVFEMQPCQDQRQAPDPRRPLKPWSLLLSGINSSVTVCVKSVHILHLDRHVTCCCCQKTIQSPDRSEWTVEKTLDHNYDSGPRKETSTNSSVTVCVKSEHILHLDRHVTCCCCQKTIQSPDRSEWTVEKTLDHNYDSGPSKETSTMVVLPSRHVMNGHVPSSMSHVISSHVTSCHVLSSPQTMTNRTPRSTCLQ